MKKLLLVLLSILAVAGLVIGQSYATTTPSTSSTKARAASLDKGLEQVVGVGDVSGGDTVEVDNRGSMSVLEYPKTVTASTGPTLNTGAALVTGAARVHAVVCSGITTSAGDYVLIYDALTATGTPVFECTVGTAKDTNEIVIPGGANFATGVFADSNASTVHAAVIYDQ